MKHCFSCSTLLIKEPCQSTEFFVFKEVFLIVLDGRTILEWTLEIRVGIKAGNPVDSAQDRDCWRALVNAALNLRVP